MYRDREEELKRLQEQLLEDEEPTEEQNAEEEELLDEETLEILMRDYQQPQNTRVYQNFSNDYGKKLRNYASGYQAYNSDKTDTELDSYSEAVREPKEPAGLLWLVIVLLALMGVVAGVILWMYIKLGGVS